MQTEPPETIPYGRQDISAADIEAVIAVLRSDFLTQGPAVTNFERHVADYCDVAHAVTANSATSALHLACAALDLRAGDTVWTVPNTFVASANCARFCNAEVDFVDIDSVSRNISISALREKLVTARAKSRLPKILIPVAFSGLPCDMLAIRTLADEYGFKVIEDASHAIGAHYRGRPVGSGEWADITIFSFHPVKIVTTGEGGMAVTNNAALAARMVQLRSHGITREPAEMTQTPEGAWFYEMLELGWNYRMTDLQAALGSSQMQRLDGFVARRNELAERYTRELADSGLHLPQTDDQSRSAWHLYTIGWNAAQSGLTRAEAFACLRNAGIGVNVHYIPVHLHPYYRHLGFHLGQFPVAEAYYANAISLPLYSGLTEAQQDRVVQNLKDLLDR